MDITEQMAGEATGIPARGELVFYNTDTEARITAEEARKRLLDGDSVGVPAAGAGSFRRLAEMLKLGAAIPHETSSTAGDWAISLPTIGHMLYQTNRFPYHGFAYTLRESAAAVSVAHEKSMRTAGWIPASEAFSQMSAVKAVAKAGAEALWEQLEEEFANSVMYVNVLTWEVMSCADWAELREKTLPT